ncbi:hypothetical protein ACWGJ9_11630 [Curtobacterium citreum]
MPDITSRVPLVKAVRGATGCGLTEAKHAVQASIDAGLGMPGLTRGALEEAIASSGIFAGLASNAASALMAFYPEVVDAPADPLDNLRVWLRQAGALGDHARVPLPGKIGGAQLTVLDLRRLEEQLSGR